MDGKLVRGNLRSKEDSGLTDLTGFLLKACRVIRFHLGDGGGEKPNQILKIIRY